MSGEQELGNSPFSTKVISPIVLSQPYEGGSEGDMNLPEQQLDTILLGQDKKEIKEVFKKLNATFNIADQGELSDYLGIKIIRNKDEPWNGHNQN